MVGLRRAIHSEPGGAMEAVVWLSLVAVFLLMFVLPQSFAELKLPFLAAIMAALLVGARHGRWRFGSGTVVYYLWFCLFAIAWSLIGLLRGNPVTAIVEAMRVYVVYTLIYFGLTICVSGFRYQRHVDRLVAYASFAIGLTTAYALADHIYSLGWLSQAVKDQLFMQVGVHPGYTQINSVNIGMLTFIVPYLFSRLLTAQRMSWRLLLALAVGVLSAALASRRMVLVLFLITPAIVFGLAMVTGSLKQRCYRACTTFYALIAAMVLAFAVILSMADFALIEGFMGRLARAFDLSQDAPRPAQHAALVSGFLDYYLFGSGFGGIASVIRSEDRPWTYELTYSRLLFNSGLVGLVVLGVYFSGYLVAAIRKIKGSVHVDLYVSLLCGFLTMLIAAASNPYLSSFDFIFAFSIVPLLLNSKDDVAPIERLGKEAPA